MPATNRRGFLLSCALGTGVLAASDQPALVTIHTEEAGAATASDFVGLGYEISSVSKAGLLSAGNSVYIQLVRTLGSRGIIRIGGNTSDFARYSADGSAVASAFGTVVNDAGLKDLGGFLQATGWKLIWGLNLGKGTEAEAIAEARAVMAAAGGSPLAFEIGNEPDLFGTAKHRDARYSYSDWLAEYRRYKKALRAEFPRIPFAGPDAAVKTDWVSSFANDEGKDIVLLTHHYYREGQNPTSSIQKLLGEDPKLQPELEKLSAASKSSGIPYRICEVNSFSGGGRPGVSGTMAGALWALDYMFTLAANGCGGVNMETGVNHRDFISSYSPIGDDERGHYSAKPEYYGMLAFSIGGKGNVLRVERQSDSDELKAYATQHEKGTLAITLINKGAGSNDVNVVIRGGLNSREASVMRLTSPSIDSGTGVSLGGAEVSGEGTWKPGKLERAHIRDGKLSLRVPAYSAAIVQIA